MVEKNRATLGGRLSAVLVAAGSAVGLGNIWRFPYIAGENGGGAFLIIYIGCILLLGIPVLLSEFAIGRHTHKNSVGAYRSLSKRWTPLGYNSVISSLLILGFYFVVSGWTLEYFATSVSGAIAEFTSSAVNAEKFTAFTTNPLRPIICTILFALLTHTVIALGVQKGIERSSKLLMPVLFVMLIVLAIRSIMMPNGLEGLRFFFNPDFSKVTGKTFLDAMGQAFFTLSIGMGAMLIYGSYFKEGTKIAGTAISVVSLDTVVALTAAVIIFSAGVENESGMQLAFVAMPKVFSSMPFGNLWATLFFLLLGLAALSSTISMHEAVTSYFVEKRGMSRKAGAAIVTIGALLLSTACSLSLGAWSEFKVVGMNLFALLDSFTAIVMLPVLGILTSIFVGWIWKKEDMRAELTAEGGVDKATYPFIRFLLKWVCPVLVSVVFIFGIIDFINSL